MGNSVDKVIDGLYVGGMLGERSVVAMCHVFCVLT